MKSSRSHRELWFMVIGAVTNVDALNEQRVAVGRRLRHGVGADNAVAAGPVFDDERLALSGRQASAPSRDQARRACPPGGNGMITRTARLGYGCAERCVTTSGASAARRRRRKSDRFMDSLLALQCGVVEARLARKQARCATAARSASIPCASAPRSAGARCPARARPRAPCRPSFARVASPVGSPRAVDRVLAAA